MTPDFASFTKAARLRDLAKSVKHCTLCTRMQQRKKVLSLANGNPEAKVLFVAEAPGRLGADRTGIPLWGDQTGENFHALLGNISWRREDVFITNAVLCNPRKENGNNATPTSEEIENCSPYLQMVIELVDPDVVVSLGTVALKALGNIAPHGLSLHEHVAKASPWRGRALVPLYHPGPRAAVHRSVVKQRGDFMRLAKTVHPTKGLLAPRPREPKTKRMGDKPTVVQQLVLAILESLGRVTHFKLTKLLYLVDLSALDTIGRTLTGEIYLRQEDGPWPPKLKGALEPMDGHEIRRFFSRGLPLISRGPSPRFRVSLGPEALEILAEVLEKYRTLSNAAIKSAVYRTPPMRYFLLQEERGRDMRRVPVIYKDRRAPDTDSNEP